MKILVALILLGIGACCGLDIGFKRCQKLYAEAAQEEQLMPEDVEAMCGIIDAYRELERRHNLDTLPEYRSDEEQFIWLNY